MKTAIAFLLFGAFLVSCCCLSAEDSEKSHFWFLCFYCFCVSTAMSLLLLLLLLWFASSFPLRYVYSLGLLLTGLSLHEVSGCYFKWLFFLLLRRLPLC